MKLWIGLGLLPLSSVWNSGSFADEKTAFGGSLRVVQHRVWLRDIAVRPLSSQRCQNNSENVLMNDKQFNSIDIPFLRSKKKNQFGGEKESYLWERLNFPIL